MALLSDWIYNMAAVCNYVLVLWTGWYDSLKAIYKSGFSFVGGFFVFVFVYLFIGLHLGDVIKAHLKCTKEFQFQGILQKKPFLMWMIVTHKFHSLINYIFMHQFGKNKLVNTLLQRFLQIWKITFTFLFLSWGNSPTSGWPHK